MLQMNLCLSGLAGCYARSAYPSAVEQAVRTIRSEDAEAVSLNEACRGDAVEIARRTGYHLRFAAVAYGATALPCVDPGGRGLFGNAVLTKQRIVSSRDGPFAAQADPEERRWLCATTTQDVTVCSSHLSTRGSVGAQRANDEQCRELASVLASYAARGATIFGGDVNRDESCAPAGSWTETDTAATQAPGIQDVYGSSAFLSPASTVVPAPYTDHDFLRVDTRLSADRTSGTGEEPQSSPDSLLVSPTTFSTTWAALRAAARAAPSAGPPSLSPTVSRAPSTLSSTT